MALHKTEPLHVVGLHIKILFGWLSKYTTSKLDLRTIHLPQ